MQVNQVRILLFATLRDRAGTRSLEMQIPVPTNVEDFKRLLGERFPDLYGLMGHMLIAVNHEYALDDAVIPLGAEVALFPPVSGG